jgi:DNA-directed RNA polymerase subunit RPC12/RpoP
MSQDKKLSELIMERMDSLEEKVDSLKISNEPKIADLRREEAHKTHETLEDALSCPNCYPKIEKTVHERDEKTKAESAKKEPVNRSTLPYVCKDCGEGVNLEDVECPTCKGRTAKPRK